MGKNTRGSKEYSREQQLTHENQQLKKQISSLRKQLARLDLDRLSYVKEIVDEHYTQETKEAADEILENIKKSWSCHKCEEGFLEISIYHRSDGIFYFRQCSSCQQRTKSKRYDPSTVKGVLKDSQKPDKNTKKS
jgi:cell division septum initiation protein DivIVA